MWLQGSADAPTFSSVLSFLLTTTRGGERREERGERRVESGERREREPEETRENDTCRPHSTVEAELAEEARGERERERGGWFCAKGGGDAHAGGINGGLHLVDAR